MMIDDTRVVVGGFLVVSGLVFPTTLIVFGPSRFSLSPSMTPTGPTVNRRVS